MVLIGDMSVVFIAGRILGCSVVTTAKNDIKARTRRDVIFLIISLAMYLSTFIVFHICVFSYMVEDVKSSLLLFTRTLLYYLGLFSDSLLTALWNWKLRSVISQLRNFDRVTKYREPATGMTLRIISCIVLVLSFLYWLIAAYFVYKVEKRMPFLRAIMYFFMDVSMNVQILMFVCILLLIERRFRHLCQVVIFSKEDKLILNYGSGGHYSLQQVWWMHCSLAKASEMLNSVYAIQLLIWISTISFNVLSRIYSLNVEELPYFGKIRDVMMVCSCGWNLIIITTVCHMTMRQANRVGELIFSPYSSVSMKRIFLQENLEAAAYFQLRKVYFSTIGDIIRVDLSLLLSIFSALTTYLVILT